jgi:hypothetical protein
LPHGWNLSPIQGHLRGISEAQGAVLTFNHKKLLGERSAPQFLQSGKLLEKLLTLLLETGVIGQGPFHIVVLILQQDRENRAKSKKPTFISST